MTLPGRNRFPRGSTEPTQSPAAASARDATGYGKGMKGLDEIAGLSTNNKPQCRGMEANTSDGRASRQSTFSHEDTSTGDLGSNVCGDEALVRGVVTPYGDTGKGTHSQGGIGGVRDGGMAGPAGETFDS